MKKFEFIINRIIAVSLCLVFFSTAVSVRAVDGNGETGSASETIIPDTTVEVTPGDINDDGKFTLADAKGILSVASDISESTNENILKSDLNGDGVVDIDDVKIAIDRSTDLDISYTLKPAKQLDITNKNGSSQKAKYVVVKSNYGETFKETPVNDKSNPLYSAQPKGTVDYYKSGPVTADDKTFYTLQSGRRVYADEVKIVNGYKLPDNEALLRMPTVTDNNSTDFYIDLDWRVPFNVTFTPQSYETGYDNRFHNVKDGKFTAQYMDITFYYTDVAEGKLSFPESDVIKNCKWIINNDDKTAKLRVYLRNAGEFYGYTAYYNKDNLLVISVKEPVDSLKGRVIEIDPGHGGEQPGAVSHNGTYESAITYKIALKLKSQLEKKGATVVLSRGNGKVVPEIEERRINTMKSNPDLFVSIHLDSSSSTSAKGSSVYYYKSYSAPLAYAISKNLPTALKSGMGYTLNNRGMHYYPFRVIRVENCPAVLVECGFISNYTEFNMQNSDKGQTCIAQGICNGIAEYFGV